MDADERAECEARLQLLDLLVEAVDDRDEVVALIASSADPQEAEERVRVRFGVTAPHLARAVVDLQLSRFTDSERARIAQDAAELREHLGRSSDDAPA